MDYEKLFVSPKSETFVISVADMMGEENEMEQGSVTVALTAEGFARVSDRFAASETFLVALRCWSDGCSAQVGEDWLRNWPPEESDGNEELPRFPLVISEDLVVKESENGYIFEDSLGIEYGYDEVVKILKEVADYFGE